MAPPSWGASTHRDRALLIVMVGSCVITLQLYIALFRIAIVNANIGMAANKLLCGKADFGN
jgi:hypothetical protein